MTGIIHCYIHDSLTLVSNCKIVEPIDLTVRTKMKELKGNEAPVASRPVTLSTAVEPTMTLRGNVPSLRQHNEIITMRVQPL
jgi:hypothetical protein